LQRIARQYRTTLQYQVGGGNLSRGNSEKERRVGEGGRRSKRA
jgi:hypothetical protein